MISRSILHDDNELYYNEGILFFGTFSYFIALLMSLQTVLSLLKTYKYHLTPRVWIFISLSVSAAGTIVGCILLFFYPYNILSELFLDIGSNFVLIATVFAGALWLKLIDVVLTKKIHTKTDTYTTGEKVILFVVQPLNIIRFLVTKVATILTGSPEYYFFPFVGATLLISIGTLCLAIIIVIKLRSEQEMSSKQPALVKMTKMAFFVAFMVVVYIIFLGFTVNKLVNKNLLLIINFVYLLVIFFIFMFGFGTGFMNETYSKLKHRFSSNFSEKNSEESSSVNLPEQLRKLEMNCNSKEVKEPETKEANASNMKDMKRDSNL